MPSLTERKTLVLLDKAEYLGRTVRTHQPQTTARLNEIYSVQPAGDGETRRLDWDFVQQSNIGLLDAATGEVRATGHTHRLNLVRATQLRNDRDRVLDDIDERHDSLKLAIEATYGPDKLALVGLDAPMVRKYLGVREQCTEMIERMRGPSLREQLGEPRASHSHLSLDELADGLESDVSRFTQAYEAVSDMGKIIDMSKVARDEARLRLRRIYTNVARMQEGMFRLAGMDELADRIRVTIRSRPKRKEEEETDDPADSPPVDSPPADTPPVDSPPAAGDPTPDPSADPIG